MGFIVGFFLSILFRKIGPQKKVYSWEVEENDIDDNDQNDGNNEGGFSVKYHYKKTD